MPARLLPAAVAVAATLSFASPALAADDHAPFTSCPAYGDQQICTAEVPSFDGAPLDVDLTLPSTGGASGRHPLMIFLHGFGNDKREWESTTDDADGADKMDWNSHWFARHGFYVLTYTARGFDTAATASGTQPPTPPGDPNGSNHPEERGTIHIKSKEFEIQDTRYLASLVADAFPDVDRDRVAISGGSYGGGESWMQAADPTWGEYTSPALHLTVAVPKYPWTDLGFSLAPNGRESLGLPGSPTGDGFPLGVAKASYITGLFAVGNTKGSFEEGQAPGPSEGPVNIPFWNTDIVGIGDPYSPEAGRVGVRQARRGLTVYRSAFYQPEWEAQKADPQTAIFSVSGWTDDLFEPIESFRMFDYLKALNPRWPVEVAVADIGHSRAQNPPEQWKRINNQAWQFLQANLNGAHEQQTTVSSQPTQCGDDVGKPGAMLTATTPEGLANGTLTTAFTRGDTQTQVSGAEDPDGLATDPIVGSIVAPGSAHDQCRRSTRPAGYTTTGYTALSAPLPKPRTYIGRGFVKVPYTLAGVTATLNARVWDVAPDGEALLVTRGTYRIDTLAAGDADPAAGTLRLPLYGNHWDLEAGHQLRLDLQEVDAPTFRPPINAPNVLTFQSPTLTLPTREAGDVTVAGG